MRHTHGTDTSLVLGTGLSDVPEPSLQRACRTKVKPAGELGNRDCLLGAKHCTLIEGNLKLKQRPQAPALLPASLAGPRHLAVILLPMGLLP